MVFEPTGVDSESLLESPDVLRLAIQISISRHRPLTTRMWENLFNEMNDAALATDLRLYELVASRLYSGQQGFEFIVRQRNRFVVTSIERGSIEIVGGVLLAAGWAYKKFIEPGWEKSHTKKDWDETVANMIDKAVPILRAQIDVRVVHRLKRLKIKRVSFRLPNNRSLQVNENTQPDTELVYDKPKQIEQKRRTPHKPG